MGVAIDSTGMPPYVMVCAGQSNAQGYDSGGSKDLAPNIWMTNSFTKPTAIIPLAFGAPPLNHSGPSAAQVVTSDPASSYNNSCAQAAIALRKSGKLSANREIVVVFNAYGSRSIGDWLDDKSASPMWAWLQTAWPLLTARYGRGWRLDALLWLQGERDNNSTSFKGSVDGNVLRLDDAQRVPVGAFLYGPGVVAEAVQVKGLRSGENGKPGATFNLSNDAGHGDGVFTTNSLYASRDSYREAFLKVVQRFQSLPYWSEKTKIVVSMLGDGFNYHQSARNDVLSKFVSGCSLPNATTVPLNDRGATFTGSIAGDMLTVTSVQANRVEIGANLGGIGVIEPTIVTAAKTGAGGAGTYTLSRVYSTPLPARPMTSQTLAKGDMTAGVENPPHHSGATTVLIGQLMAQRLIAGLSGQYLCPRPN